MKRFGVAVLALAVALSVGVALAQPPGRGAGQRGGMQPGAFGQQANIAVIVQVFADELDAGPAEIMEIRTIVREAAQDRPEGLDFGALRDLTPQERAERMGELQAAVQQRQQEILEKAKEVLGEDAGERLEQLVLQAQGPRAVLNPAVVEELGLDDGQVAAIRTALRGGPTERPAEGADFRALMAERQAAIEEAVRDELTQEQREKLDEMLGERVENLQERLRAAAGPRPGAGEGRQRPGGQFGPGAGGGRRRPGA